MFGFCGKSSSTYKYLFLTLNIGLSSFNADLSNWDTSSVTEMKSIFQEAVVSVCMTLK